MSSSSFDLSIHKMLMGKQCSKKGLGGCLGGRLRGAAAIALCLSRHLCSQGGCLGGPKC